MTQRGPSDLVAFIGNLDERVEVVLTDVAERIWLPFNRRKLIMFKDDLRADLRMILASVKSAKTVEAGLRTALKASDDAHDALIARIAEMQAAPGAWTDDDIAAIKADVQAVKDEFNAEAIVAAVLANTPEAPAEGGASG